MHNPVVPLLEPALGHALRVLEQVQRRALLFAGGRDVCMRRAHASPATICLRVLLRRFGRCHFLPRTILILCKVEGLRMQNAEGGEASNPSGRRQTYGRGPAAAPGRPQDGSEWAQILKSHLHSGLI